jgi:uracil-DNA glycosylase family 4
MNLEKMNSELIQCRQCPRLVEWREQMAREKRKAYRDQDYWGKPVPGFGDPQARVFVIGLAPGAHGSNRTGRQFTGDASGNFLYPALYRAGFANRPDSTSRDDGLALTDMYMAAAARCAPPENKPTPQELAACQPYLETELQLIQPKVLVALGRIAFDAILRILSPVGSSSATLKFSHAAVFTLTPSRILLHNTYLICSYHPSQQNTLTGKLTVEMFDQVWQKARVLANTSADADR